MRGLSPFLHAPLPLRRMIKGGGIYLNNQKVLEELLVVREENLIDGKMLLVAAGKKNKLLVRITE